MFELLTYLFLCCKKISFKLHSHAQAHTIHSSEPWSHAPITLLSPLVFPCPPFALLYCIPVTLPWTPPSHDSVPLLLYTAVFSRPPELYNCTLPVNHHAHLKAVQPSRDWNPSLYCRPTSVRLAIHMHRRQTNTNSMYIASSPCPAHCCTGCIRAINACNTWTTEQDWACPGNLVNGRGPGRTTRQGRRKRSGWSGHGLTNITA